MDSAGEKKGHQTLAMGLILLGVVARLIPHPPNVTPLTAIALFGGTSLPKRWAILLPLVIVAISDLLIGLHDVVAFTWSSLALTGLLGWWIRKRAHAARIAFCAIAGSTIFFLVTNFGVWLVGDGGLMYPKTFQGLWLCYIAALPFYRNALIGDLVFTAAIFGLYALATKRQLLYGIARLR